MVSPVSFGMTVNRAQPYIQSSQMANPRITSQQLSQASHKTDLFFKGKHDSKALKPEQSNTLVGIIAELKKPVTDLNRKIAKSVLTVDDRQKFKCEARKLNDEMTEAFLSPEKRKAFEASVRRLDAKVTEANFTQDKIARLRLDYELRQKVLKTIDQKERKRLTNQPDMIALNSKFIDALTASTSKSDTDSSDEEQSLPLSIKNGKEGTNMPNSEQIAALMDTVAGLKSQITQLKHKIAEARLTPEQGKEFSRTARKLETKIAEASVKPEKHKAFEGKVTKLETEIAEADFTDEKMAKLKKEEEKLQLKLNPLMKKPKGLNLTKPEAEQRDASRKALQAELFKVKDTIASGYVARKVRFSTISFED